MASLDERIALFNLESERWCRRHRGQVHTMECPKLLWGVCLCVASAHNDEGNSMRYLLGGKSLMDAGMLDKEEDA